MLTKAITLALQGGGSHGAFTWGVLDRLLEDERIKIEALTGASAGAMNTVALAHGMTIGGRGGARQALKGMWDSIATKAPFNFMPEDWSTPESIARQQALPRQSSRFSSWRDSFLPTKSIRSI